MGGGLGEAVEYESLDPPDMAGLAVDPVESLEYDTMEAEFPTKEVADGFPTIVPRLTAVEILDTGENPVLGQRAWGKGIGVDPKPEGLQLGGSDPPKVLDDMGGDVTPLPAALGEAGIDSPCLGRRTLR